MGFLDFLKPKPRRRGKLQPKSEIHIPKTHPQSIEPERPPQPPPVRKEKTAAKQEDHKKEFEKVFKQLTYRHRPWDIWRDMITMFACTLSNPVDKNHHDEREALYLKTIKKYNKQEQSLFPELFAQMVLALEYNPEQDFLGDLFMEFELGDDAKKQIFTPYTVCQLMAAITLGEDIASQVEKDGYITIHDPCCGAGATLIAGVHEARRQLEKTGLNYQNHVLVVAQDIDFVVAMMCYIQLSLLGVAAYIKVGNSLTDPMCSGDSLDNYWFTPMYFSSVWTMRRLLKGGFTDGSKQTK